MIECHPLLRPIVNLAKPVVHAAKTWHPKVVGVRHHVHHHVHRALNAATPPQAVLTVCQRVAGPILAGGLVLLPPASAPPPAGGVGGFPGAIVPEYGAPAFGPGYASNAYGYAPGTGYGPAALGLGGILAPAVLAPSIAQTTSPGTSTPTTPVVTQNVPPSNPTTPTVLPSTTQPGTTTPPPTDGPTNPQQTTPTPPTNPPDKQPGETTPPPVNTPEPASIAVLAGAFAIAVFSRAMWTRRTRRG